MIENPVLLDLPMPIKTPRLIITAPDPAIAKKLYEAKEESLPKLREWMGWAANDPKRGDEKTTLTKALAKFILREDLMMLAFTHEGEFIAASGFVQINWNIPRSEIGYWCRTSMEGKGYVTEICNALTRYAFEVLNMRKLTIDIDSENVKSIAIPKRLGFHHEYDDLGGIVKPGATELRIRSVFSRYNCNDLPPLDVSWGNV